MKKLLELFKFLRDLVIMFLSLPMAFLAMLEDRDILADDDCYQG